MIYKSCISNANKVIFAFVFIIIILATIPIFNSNDLTSFIIVVSINLAALFFLAWILFDTEYRIDKTHLYCKSGPFQKNIAIEKINKIEYHKGIIVPVTLKLALSHEGLIVTYNYYDEVYISPESENEFIDILLRINSNIKIIPKKDEL
ncbi:PH domain-containing protein [Flavobacterium sp. J27]|uniref:PH domain-containing protein n=1 Tax=Flavobacterium sp. J27 TaxID=2060419 RepID=UPI0010325812|nr:PH domain-containing protein [Flavobacterium sp. J27]